MIPISLLACRDNCLAASNIAMAGSTVLWCPHLNDTIRCLLPNRIGPSICVPFAFYFNVELCNHHVACISETSCLRNIVRLTEYFSLDTTVYCHVDLDQLLNQAQLQSLAVALHMPTCQFNNWRNLYFVKIDQVFLAFSTFLEIARVPSLHHLNTTAWD